MESILNRLAWFVSLLFGITLCILFFGGSSYYSFFDEGFSMLFWGCILGTFIKFFFFSSDFLNSAVKKYSNNVDSNVNSIVAETTIETKTSTEKQTSYVDSIISENTIASKEEKVLPILPVIEKIVPDEPSQFSIWLHAFFADRPLAKVGGILLFLGALFFLWLIFDIVGPVGKVLIGMAFGFFLIAMGVYLDQKMITTESRVLFGIGIAVNYLTILSGRHLLGDGMGGGNQLFSDGFATFALLLNTGLAVALSLVYRSRVLLGFAFIFAYLIPFLVGSSSSSVLLLVIYTTILTLAIAVINYFYIQIQDDKNTKYLQSIGVVGMTFLLAIASLDASSKDIISIFVGLFASVAALTIFAYKTKSSPLSIFIGAYLVLFMVSFGNASFALLPIGIIGLILLMGFFVLQGVITILIVSIFSGLLFFLGLIGFWIDGASSIGILFSIGFSIFALIAFLVMRTASMMLAIVGIIGFGLLSLFGISTHLGQIDANMIISTKIMSLVLIIGASIFTFRLRDAFYFFIAIIFSGILIVYPDTFDESIGISLISAVLYLVISLTVPYFLTRTDEKLGNKSFLIGSLPISALVITYAIYQLGHIKFPGLALGLAYILQALIYLAYAMATGSRFLPKENTGATQAKQEHKNILLILFALPLSLFTLALAFVFGDVPGIMSLAWIIESTILYLVYTRMKDARLFIGASVIFVLGLMKMLSFLGDIDTRDWLTLGILCIMLVSVFSSLYILRNDTSKNRVIYDILHSIAVLCIGIGVAQIIPSTGTGWSLLGISIFLLIIIPVYFAFGKTIQKVFGSILFGFLCTFYIGEFDYLIKNTGLAIFVQFFAISVILGIGYVSYIHKQKYGYINLTISLIGMLIVSSMYVDHFLGTFAVSIYLTIVASILIIRGIILSLTDFRTIGLYIGTFALLKILGYDIWQGEYGTIIRVLALMIAGGLMIYLSQLYAKYVSRTWREEFSLGYFIDGLSSSDSKKEDTESDFIQDTGTPFSIELEEELKDVVISDISSVRFVLHNGTSFTIKRASILRIAKHITTTLHKTEFAPNELSGAYDYIVHNLSSKLSEDELAALLLNFRTWIQEGGKVEFNSKK